ncbi:hypothetical protein HPB47_019342, partial [Ixodes persulcatus]
RGRMTTHPLKKDFYSKVSRVLIESPVPDYGQSTEKKATKLFTACLSTLAKNSDHVNDVMKLMDLAGIPSPYSTGLRRQIVAAGAAARIRRTATTRAEKKSGKFPRLGGVFHGKAWITEILPVNAAKPERLLSQDYKGWVHGADTIVPDCPDWLRVFLSGSHQPLQREVPPSCTKMSLNPKEKMMKKKKEENKDLRTLATWWRRGGDELNREFGDMSACSTHAKNGASNELST